MKHTVSINQKNSRIKQIFLLHCVVLLYTTSGIFAKLASNEGFMSWGFILFYGAEICILGIYAILWQQIIKRVDLSLAYANRAIALLWSMLWAFLFFDEVITVKNIIGVIIVIIGTMIVNSEHE